MSFSWNKTWRNYKFLWNSWVAFETGSEPRRQFKRAICWALLERSSATCWPPYQVTGNQRRERSALLLFDVKFPPSLKTQAPGCWCCCRSNWCRCSVWVCLNLKGKCFSLITRVLSTRPWSTHLEPLQREVIRARGNKAKLFSCHFAGSLTCLILDYAIGFLNLAIINHG